MNIEYADSLDSDPFVTAFRYKARYLISGVIEKFDIIQKAEITVRADEYREIMTGTVKLRLEITDVFDKKVISQENMIGEVSRKNKAENTWESLKSVPFDFSNQAFSQSIIGMALQQAFEQALEKCDASLGL
jgi:carbamate kinase